MALTPQNNDAFFREVDDELRRTRLDAFGRRWGIWIGVGILVALALFGGWLWYRHSRTEAAGVAGEQLDAALTALSENQTAKAKPILTTLAAGDRDGYRAAAKLALADVMMQDGDVKGAAAAFKAVAEDTALDQAYRDLALVRQTAAEYDTLPPAQVIARLKPLAVPGHAWFGSAGEMTAAAHLRMNRPDLAGPIFAGIAKDETIPGTLRTRAAQMASSMGLEVPVPGQNDTGGERQ